MGPAGLGHLGQGLPLNWGLRGQRNEPCWSRRGAHTCWLEGASKGVSRRELYRGRGLPGQLGLHPELCSDPLLLRPSPGLKPQSSGTQTTPPESSLVPGGGEGPGAAGLQVSALPSSGTLLLGAVGAGALLLTVAAPLRSPRGSSPCPAQAGPPPTTNPSLAASPLLSLPNCTLWIFVLVSKGQPEGGSSVSPLDRPASVHLPLPWTRA